MDKRTKDSIFRHIGITTIPEELKALYMMANATDIVCTQSFNRIKSVYKLHGVSVNENSLLSGINQYCDLVKRATFHFFQRIEPQICDATYGAHKGDSGAAEAYDTFAEDSNEIVRLVLLYIDRTANNRDGAKQVFDLLQSLPSGGLLKDKDIEKYRLK